MKVKNKTFGVCNTLFQILKDQKRIFWDFQIVYPYPYHSPCQEGDTLNNAEQELQKKKKETIRITIININNSDKDKIC